MSDKSKRMTKKTVVKPISSGIGGARSSKKDTEIVIPLVNPRTFNQPVDNDVDLLISPTSIQNQLSVSHPIVGLIGYVDPQYHDQVVALINTNSILESRIHHILTEKGYYIVEDIRILCKTNS